MMILESKVSPRTCSKTIPHRRNLQGNRSKPKGRVGDYSGDFQKRRTLGSQPAQRKSRDMMLMRVTGGNGGIPWPVIVTGTCDLVFLCMIKIGDRYDPLVT